MATEHPPLPKLFLDAVDLYKNPRAQMYRSAQGWENISANEMLRRVAALSQAFVDLGVQPGDRLGLFAPNCPEWHIADFAAQGIGAVVVPVYFNESPDRLIYILNDSGAGIVFVSGEAEARKLLACSDRIPAVEHVICVSPPPDLPREILRYETLIAPTGSANVAVKIAAQVEEYRQRSATVAGDQLATIIYTSGTTGEPKGVMLTHENLSSNAHAFSIDFDMTPSDVALSLLPLAHVYERTIDYSYFLHGVSVAYVEQIETVPQALLEVRPTMMVAVPRLYEKTYANIVERGRSESGVKRRLFDWALGVAAQAIPWRAYGMQPSSSLKFRWQIADRIVYSKIRAGLGGKLRVMSAGGAPLARELAEFFWSIGMPVYQGYGLTETSPVVSANTPKANKVGTVGRPVADVKVRIAADGEILVKGPCVMHGYYRKPEDTRAAISPDGWFSTGDIGRLDEDGYLVITDRKKELLKTAGGKFVAPAPIENILKTSPYISNAIVVGDKRKFVSVLVVANVPAIEAAAKKDGHEFASPSQMLSDPWARDLLSREIERLTAPLAQYEKPKRFAILENDFSYAKGEVTYTIKLKRRVIEDHYQDVIARLYADVEEPRPSHPF
jgi:long-chain acyl-CoA synthetase